MNCVLTRKQARTDGVFGELRDESGNLLSVTLEHAFSDGAGGFKPAIPAGTYTCTRYLSPKHGYEVFVLQNVPGHTFCEIHIGNFNRDSDGCVLLGETVQIMATQQMITNSGATFRKFMKLQEGVDSFPLVIRKG